MHEIIGIRLFTLTSLHLSYCIIDALKLHLQLLPLTECWQRACLRDQREKPALQLAFLQRKHFNSDHRKFLVYLEKNGQRGSGWLGARYLISNETNSSSLSSINSEADSTVV